MVPAPDLFALSVLDVELPLSVAAEVVSFEDEVVSVSPEFPEFSVQNQLRSTHEPGSNSLDSVESVESVPELPEFSDQC